MIYSADWQSESPKQAISLAADEFISQLQPQLAPNRVMSDWLINKEHSEMSDGRQALKSPSSISMRVIRPHSSRNAADDDDDGNDNAGCHDASLMPKRLWLSDKFRMQLVILRSQKLKLKLEREGGEKLMEDTRDVTSASYG